MAKLILQKTLLTILLFFSISVVSCQVEKKAYTDVLKEIEQKCNYFSELYSKANTSKKDSIIKVSRAYLTKTLSKDVFEYWYGTPWDFNGMTRTPKKGKIACGYFVTNLLTDIGFSIPRIKWAQSPSEVYIKRLALKKDIKRFTNTPVKDVKSYLKKVGNGIYVVGLDIHAGFIVVENGEARFVHASYYKPEIGVVSEKLDSHNPLKDSKYRVIGKLFSDTMIKNWFNKTKYH